MADETLIAVTNILQSGDTHLTQQIGDKDGYCLINKITATTATSNEDIKANIAFNIKRNVLRIENYHHFKKITDTPIAIVGGGPSLKYNLNKLREFQIILIAGSAHDYLVSKDIVADYCALCDPSPLTLGYIKAPQPHTTYFLASGCDPLVFDKLKNNKVYLWHCYTDLNKDYFYELEPTCHMIGGGCTIGLRSINIAIMLGYYNIHLFGFDGCLSEKEENYAYPIVDKEELKGISNIFNIKLDYDSDKKYKVVGYQLAQADHFKDFLYKYSNMVNFTFHGDGLLRDLHDRIKLDIQRLNGVIND